jgi:oxaloacetate decarboxylase beta subunit
MSIPIWEVFQGIYTLFISEPQIAIARVALIFLGMGLVYLGYKGILEALIMIPLGLGMIGVNAAVMVIEGTGMGTLFLDPMVSEPNALINIMQIDFLQPIYSLTFSNGLIACLVFIGIGAITDLDFLIAKPMPSLLLATAAEFGTIFTFPIAMAMGFPPGEAASISIVGGADGPMVLFTSLQLAPHLFVPIAIVAYIYLSLVYAGYPYLIKGLIPKSMRWQTMDLSQIPKVSRGEKFAFSIIAAAVLSLLFPVAAPLFICFFLGQAVKEANLPHLQEFMAGPCCTARLFSWDLSWAHC